MAALRAGDNGDTILADANRRILESVEKILLDRIVLVEERLVLWTHGQVVVGIGGIIGEPWIYDLSGIGEEYADKVIAGRPYKNKKELKTRKILPPSNYKQIADKITAKQTTK